MAAARPAEPVVPTVMQATSNRENHFACSLRLAIFFSSSHNFHNSSRASLSDPVFLVLDRWPIRSAPGGPQPATS